MENLFLAGLLGGIVGAVALQAYVRFRATERARMFGLMKKVTQWVAAQENVSDTDAIVAQRALEEKALADLQAAVAKLTVK